MIYVIIESAFKNRYSGCHERSPVYGSRQGIGWIKL